MYRLPSRVTFPAPRGTVFTDGSPEICIYRMSRKSRIVNTYALVVLFLVHLLPHARAGAPHGTRDKGPVYLLSAEDRRPKERSVDINLAAREEKRERKRKRREGEGEDTVLSS